MEPSLTIIEQKVLNDQRIEAAEALFLFEHAELGFLGRLASHRREKWNGNHAWFNRNFHIEPTNICIHNCLFCSYRRRIGQDGAWEMDADRILDEVRTRYTEGVTEVHIVGGVHPSRDLDYYAQMLSRIHQEFPALHIKAFTAVELDFMIRKSKLSYREGLQKLKEAGLNSIPGGGAEIFDEELRKQICPDKTDSATWLLIHQTAHEVGIPSNLKIMHSELIT